MERLLINAATSSTASDFFLHSLYAPNKDVDVEMDLYGGKGDNCRLATIKEEKVDILE